MTNIFTLFFNSNKIMCGTKCRKGGDMDLEVEAALDGLKDVEFVPSEDVVKNILSYAKSLDVLHSENVGGIEVILN